MRRSDSALIRACLSGSQAAWDTLVERYGRLVYSIPRKHGLSDADADDIFQAVFISLFRALDRLKDQEKLSSWLITTTHRETWRIGKRAKRNAGSELSEDAVASGEIDAAEIERLERQAALHQALTMIGGRCEQLLRALFLDPESPNYDTVAERLGMSVGSIGPTRARCFEKLERILAQMTEFREDAARKPGSTPNPPST